MEVDQEQEKTSKEILVYMEFDNKSKDYLFDNPIFFRMARFEDSPLIQLNNHIFRGEYKPCLGTNLFFSDCKESESDVFDFGSTIKLKHQATQSKVLQLKPVKIPTNTAELPRTQHDIKINKNYDYKSLLKKFADGTLDMKEDLIVVPRREVDDASIPKVQQEKIQKVQPKQKSRVVLTTKPASVKNKVLKSKREVEKPLNIHKRVTPFEKENNEKVVNIITHKLEKLRNLAMRPTRRKKEPEEITECEEKYKKSYIYNSLKCTVMKPSDYFRTISEKFSENTLVGAVDIDRSVIQGVINKSTEYHRVLSGDEKLALMSIKNFENLSMPARYMVIKSHLEHLESTFPTLCDDEVYERDGYGRTVRENIKLYKRLLRVLGGLVKQKYAYDSDVEEN